MKRIAKLILSGIMLFGLLFSPKIAFAENESGAHFVVGPTSQKIFLTPGESYRSNVSVSNPNDSKTNVNLILYAAPYGVINENYDPSFSQETTYTQIKNWIKLDQDEVTISPNEKIDVGFTINVPENAPAGGQYATIIAQNKIEGDQHSGMSITDIAAIGSIIVAEVAGETHEEGVVYENNIPSFLMNNTLEATSMVRNNGNVHTDAEYILQVWPLFSGEEICTNEENPGTSLIMPETERYHTESCQLPAVGIFRAKQTVKIFGEESIVEKTIIVCPIWLLFIIIFAIFALIFYFIAKSKARKKAAKTSQTK